MNKTITIGTLLTSLLLVGFLATSALAAKYYQAATKATARAVTAEAKSRTLADQLAQANSNLQTTQVKLNDALKRLGLAQGQLRNAQGELGRTQGQLGQTQSKLSQTEVNLSQVQQESQRRLQVIFAQADNVKVLKTCLGGFTISTNYFVEGLKHEDAYRDNGNQYDAQMALDNFEKAKAIMDNIDTDCKRAYALFQ